MAQQREPFLRPSLRAEGRLDEALAETEKALEARHVLGPIYPGVKIALAEAVEAAFQLDDLERVEQLLSMIDELPAGDSTPFQRAQRDRFGARLAVIRGEADRVEPGYKSAAGLFREIGTPFWLGETLLEHGEWLSAQGRADEANPLFDEAREIFERLEARPRLERLEKVAGPRAEVVAPG